MTKKIGKKFDEEDRKKVLRKILEEQESDCSLSFLESFIKKTKNRGESIFIHDAHDEVGKLCVLYEKRLQEDNAFDLDDLLVKPLELFHNCSETLKKYRQHWSHFLVDEYQDTNEAQSKLLFLLGEPNYNICFVGDPDQAIYSWRGATIRNILSIPKALPNAVILPLEKNYRSTNAILRAANSLISHNKARFNKELWSDLGEGPSLTEYVAYSELDEAFQIAKSILELNRKGIQLRDIAVLYRTHALSKPIEDALLCNRIPYIIFGGPSFYQRKEIKDALAFFNILHHPKNRCSAERVLDLLPGVGKKSRDRILETLNETEDFSISLRKGLEPSFKSTPQQKSSFSDLLSLFNNLNKNRSDLYTIAQKVANYHLLRSNLKDPIEERIQNLDEFVIKVLHWQEQDPNLSLSDFLTMIALTSGKKWQEEDTNQVQLMTIHCAKGLEFDTVFLIGLEKGLFPVGESDELEEERRLFYVGMTRAKQRLIFTRSQKRTIWGQTRFQSQSIFLDNLMGARIERHFVKPYSIPFQRYES
ncbi:ATP-dependent helicase [Candidatus Similichlamydia epinepheli]|uniref:ATP-dependent helicase n=1 Tax=Candidatus Similichlamydia epinepheli TaxID=1903953 RepID=UPI000D3A1870|nr:3'-5' exonuclease [Candidatus Similichlamydia epinepheli]